MAGWRSWLHGRISPGRVVSTRQSRRTDDSALGGSTDLGALQSLPVGYDGKVPKGRDVSPGVFAIQYDLAAHR